MRFIFREISLGLDEDISLLPGKIKKQYSARVIGPVEILRESIDARRGSIALKYTVAAQVENEAQLLARGFSPIAERAPVAISPGNQELRGRPVVAGLGPCGLFAAYGLAREGYQPIVLERGKPVEERTADFERLRQDGTLDPESNVCFGEGGAGAFSDGKLTTRIKDKDGKAAEVLRILAECGAPAAIQYQAKPHLGTDVIRQVVRQLRQQILALGGTICYGARLADIHEADGQVCRIIYRKDGQDIAMDTNALILAIGHSARDTFALLRDRGIAMEQKPFAIGVRVEHRREYIDRCQYGKYADHPRLGAADYKLTAKSGDRGVYSFCMCPGGEVVCSATEEGMTAVNGMSYFKRDMENSNSAIIVSVRPEDMEPGPMGGVALQRQIERAAFAMAGGYGAVVQTVPEFIRGETGRGSLPVSSSYQPYTVRGRLDQCLPGFIRRGIADGFSAFERAMPGFSRQGLLVGVETRSSSPVRLLRGKAMESVALEGLYPAGEGAGYAGGIVSSAVDGLRAAEAVIQKFRRPD